MDRITSNFVVPRLVAGLCAFIGLANLAGWVFDWTVFISIAEALPKMVPATTTLVLLTAGSLACQARSRPLRGTALVLGALAALFAW